MNDAFYTAIERDITSEALDNNKYVELAKMAPTDKARKILLDIAAEEKLHHKYLNEILNDRPVASGMSNTEGDKNAD